MILDTTIRLEAVLAGAVSANQPEVHVDYIDWAITGLPTNPIPSRTQLNSTTDVTILAAPTVAKAREIQRIAIYNKDTASVTVTVKTDDGTTERIIIKKTIGTLDSLCWEKGLGWYTTATQAGIFTTLTVTGAATLQSTLSVTGAITAAGATFSGNVNLGDASGDAHILTGATSMRGSGASVNLALRDTDAYSDNTNGATLFFQGLDSGATNTNLAFLNSRATGSNSGYLQIYTRASGANTLTAQFGTGTTAAVSFGGSITTSAPTGGAGAWELGIANAVSPTSPNRTLTVEIGGTAYYIHAKTSND